MTRTRRVVVTASTALCVSLVLVAGGFVGLGWWISDSVVKPDHQHSTNPDHSDVVLRVEQAGSETNVVIGDPDAHARRPGTYRMVWDGVEAVVGDVIAASPDSVARPILRGAVPSVGTTVAVTDVMISDPKSSLGLDYDEVSIPTELGPAPAWYVPASGPAGSTWVIAVHGQNGRRNAMLAIPAFHRLGLPVLAMTYRNDEGAPVAPDGLMHYGESEYRDVESAVRYAQGMGAQRVVLYGSSMGGQIVGQFLVRSSLATDVSALLLDSPLVSMPAIAAFSGQQNGAPDLAIGLTSEIIYWRTGVDMDQLDLIAHPPAVKPPMLLIAGTADSQAPVQMERDFAGAAPGMGWTVDYQEFPGAEHVESWNSDPARYENAVADFFARELPAARP